MLKVKVETKTEPLYVLGLEEENIKRLKEGEPILFENKIFGIEGKTLIFYGETHQDLREELTIMFGIAEHREPIKPEEK